MWHDDGHAIYLRLEKSKLRVSPMPCPHDEHKDSACYHAVYGGCVVNYFVQMFGLDCNVGVADPAPELAIAWARQGDPYDIDATQVWVVPTTDDNFQSFVAAQTASVVDTDV